MLIDILTVFLVSFSFWKINILFVILFTLLFLSFYRFKWLYFLVIILSIIWFKNPFPAFLIYLYEKVKAKEYFLIAFLSVAAFFYSIKVALISSLIVFLYIFRKRSYILLFLIPLIFIPSIFSPIKSVGTVEYEVTQNLQVDMTQSSKVQENSTEPVKKEEVKKQVITDVTVSEDSNLEKSKIFGLFFVSLAGLIILYIFLRLKKDFSFKILAIGFLTFLYAFLIYFVLVPYIAKANNSNLLSFGTSNVAVEELKTGEFEKNMQATKTEITIEEKPLIKPIYILRFINIISVIVFAISLYVLFMFLSATKKQVEVIKGKENIWKSEDTFEDLIDIEDGRDFIRRAYLYLRAKIFKEFFYLTPYELMNVINDKNLEYFTEIFVKSQYKLEDVTFNLEVAKQKLKELIEKYTPPSQV